MNNTVEIVNGTVIGPVTFPYEFWTTDAPTKRITAGRHFCNDADAVQWFEQRFPEEFANGAEMRCFDN